MANQMIIDIHATKNIMITPHTIHADEDEAGILICPYRENFIINVVAISNVYRSFMIRNYSEE